MSSMRKSKRTKSDFTKGELVYLHNVYMQKKSEVLEAELIEEEPTVKRRSTTTQVAAVPVVKKGFGLKAVAAMVVASILGGSLLMNMNKGNAIAEDLCNLPSGNVENVKGEVVAISEGMTANDVSVTIATPSSNCTAKVGMRTSQVNFKSGDVISITGSSDGFGLRADSIVRNPVGGFKANGTSTSHNTIVSLHASMLRSTYSGDGTYSIVIDGNNLLVPGELAGKVSNLGFQNYMVGYSGRTVTSIEME